MSELGKISDNNNFYFKPVKPKRPDSKIIGLATLVRFKSVDAKYQLFIEIKDLEIKSKIERSVYNRRKRKLISYNNALLIKFNYIFSTVLI